MNDTKLNKVSLINKINETPAVKLADIPEVGDKFKHLYQVMHGVNNGSVFYESEKFHFAKLIQENKSLQECSKLSLYGVFMDVAVSGLSFDPNAKQVYIVPFNTNIGTKNSPKWEKRASLMISGYGELALRIKQKQVLHVDNPVLVYEGDEFVTGTRGGGFYLEHKSVIPRKSDNIIACYLRIVRVDGSIDYSYLSMEEIQALRKFSKDPNSKAWTDGLPGMVKSKTIKHAFKTYPKIKIGDYSQQETNTIEAEVVEEKPIDYGIGEDNQTEEAEVLNDESFMAQTEKVETVTFEDDDF